MLHCNLLMLPRYFSSNEKCIAVYYSIHGVSLHALLCKQLMLPRYFEDPESAKQCNVLQYTWCVVIYVTLQPANAPQVLCVQRKVHRSVLQYTWSEPTALLGKQLMLPRYFASNEKCIAVYYS